MLLDRFESLGDDATTSTVSTNHERSFAPSHRFGTFAGHSREVAFVAARQLNARARFLRLWRDHRSHLQALGRRWLAGNPTEAEDAVADVFYKACATYRGEDGAIADERAWLSRMLHNRCMDSHRRRRAAIKIFLDGAASEDGADVPILAVSSPEDELLNAELGRIIHQALAELPEPLRGPIVMRLVHDEPYGKVAKAYDISMANARKRIQQARSILRARLSRYIDTGE